MAKRPNAPICSRCETPFRRTVPFCDGCGGPTPWASHDDRVAWEVRQWRASRETVDRDAPQMMLVRTQSGFEPMPVAGLVDYVWDQPLHPEREPEPAPAPAPNPQHHAPAPVEAAEVAEPVQGSAASSNGNGYGHGDAPSSGTIAPQREDLVQEPRTAAPAPATPAVDGVLQAAGDDRVTVSKKAVALGIALVVGLPFGSRLIGAGDDASRAPGRPPAAPAAGKPAPVAAALWGFEQLSPDVVRYAVVVKNPNKSYAASGLTVRILVHDAAGRLVGGDTESVPVLSASATTGLAGAVGVSGPAARMTVKVGTAAFREARPASPFRVRSVRLTRSSKQVTASASVTGSVAAKGARVVAVYLDRAGKVVGGDFTFVDVPRAPRSVAVTITTAGIRRTVARVHVYVLPPR